MRLGDPYNLSDLRPRAIFLGSFFIFMLFLLFSRMWYLQIWKGEQYRQFADQNRFKIKRIAAPRGQIYDRNGNLIADNRPRFDVNFTRAYAANVTGEFEQLQKIFNWNAEDYQKKLDQVKKAGPYQPVQIARDVPWDQLAQIEAHSLDLGSVDIDVLAVRDYLYGDSFFHVIGYTGEINDRELKILKEKYPKREYRLGDSIGVIGVENLYEGVLRGRDGEEFIVVDVKGRPVKKSGLKLFDQSTRKNAEAGFEVYLTLDLELQLAAYRALEGKRGAAVAIDPKTGEVLAMVSRPGLDPNLFTTEISPGELKTIQDRPDKPFLDRTLAEHYPPGSTFKIVMATAALESQVITPETIINCPGTYRLGRRVWHDHNHAGFGPINVVKAIQKSSNVFFFNIGMMLGLDTMYEWASRFGLGRRTNLGNELFIDHGRIQSLKRFNHEQSGFIPNSAWVDAVGNTTVAAETINAGIGQGAFLASITQLARMMTLIGNEGKVFQPQLLKEIRDQTGKRVKSFHAVLENQIQFHPGTLETVKKGISAVVNEAGGTAWRARVQGIEVGGKTGTSQVVSLTKVTKEDLAKNESLRDHALFVGLAPLDNPQIAVAVIVENGESGGHAAAPVAKVMIENYLKRESRRGS